MMMMMIKGGGRCENDVEDEQQANVCETFTYLVVSLKEGLSECIKKRIQLKASDKNHTRKGGQSVIATVKVDFPLSLAPNRRI